MTKSKSSTKSKDPNSKYDLEERTTQFGKDIVEFAKKIPKTPVTIPIITQLVKSETSIGANYCEADGAESKRDFKNKLGICKKESRESKHFLRMLAKACPELKEDIRSLLQEAKELNLIFNSIFNKVS